MSHAFLRTPSQKDTERAIGEVLTGPGGWYGRFFSEYHTADETYGPYETQDEARHRVARRANKPVQLRQMAP
jgi:hypothetical protein